MLQKINDNLDVIEITGKEFLAKENLYTAPTIIEQPKSPLPLACSNNSKRKSKTNTTYFSDLDDIKVKLATGRVVSRCWKRK